MAAIGAGSRLYRYAIRAIVVYHLQAMLKTVGQPIGIWSRFKPFIRRDRYSRINMPSAGAEQLERDAATRPGIVDCLLSHPTTRVAIHGFPMLS